MNVPDNGSTSIPWSFFSIYPPGGHIILWIARGNYTIASNGDYQYKVGGYSAASVWDVLVPYPTVQGSFTASNGWQTSSASVSSSGSVATCDLYLSKTPSPTNWSTPFIVGRINGCTPRTTQTFFSVGLGGGNWSTTVESISGTVTTHWVSGAPPPAGTSTIRINGQYNIN